MTKWKIRSRLTVWNLAVLVLILVGFASSMLLMLRAHLYQRDDEVLIEELAELVEEIGRHGGKDGLAPQLEQRFSVHSHYYFQVLLESREVLFRSRFLSRLQLPIPEKPAELRGRFFQDLQLPQLGHYRLLTQAIRDSNGKPLLVQVMASRANLDRELQSYLWIAGESLAMAVIAASIFGFLLARWALAPIDRIIGIAERISAETLTQRLEVTNPHDELGRLATTLNRMFDRLNRSIEEMRRFTADAAHELRSPLAVMRTEAEVVLRNPRELSVYHRAIEVNLEETKRLGDLVDQLLILSRHDAGLLRHTPEDVEIDALVRDVCDRFETVATERGITIEVTCEQPCIVRGDDIALSRLLYNLLDNALNHTPAGGCIRVAAVVTRNLVQISLEDTGVGIPQEHLPYIFGRFYRIDFSRNRELGGAGLGLAICKSIVEGHQGEISVSSTLGSGTRFVVVLPRIPEPEEMPGIGARNVHGAN